MPFPAELFWGSGYLVKIQFFGHSFFKVGFSKGNVLIDPFVGESKNSDVERKVKCAATKKDLRNIALILVTHEHFDHFDKQVIEELVARDNCCVVSYDNVLQDLNIANRFKFPLKMNQKVTLRNIDVTALPAHHPNSFYPLGFLISAGNESVYHAGDTALLNSFSEIKADVAILPIGGTYTMDVVDAVRAVKTMKPKYAIPMHYDTFDSIKQDPREFTQRIEKSVLKTKPLVMKPGQKVNLKV